MKKIKIEAINCELEVKAYVEENTFVRFILWDPDSGNELTEQAHFNWGNDGYAHPFVKFSNWAKESGWTRAYNLDFRIHDLALAALVNEDYVPQEALDFALKHPKDNPRKNGKFTVQFSKQTAPKPQTKVSEIMKSKIKVTQTQQSKQEHAEVVMPKPQKAEGFKIMTDEELEKEIHKISDFENDFVDPDLL